MVIWLSLWLSRWSIGFFSGSSLLCRCCSMSRLLRSSSYSGSEKSRVMKL